MLPEPSILTHPQIPKPLHGVNPRTILGKDWWDTERFKAQKDYGYYCAACGVHKTEALYHKWLEGHEYFDINYQTGLCKVIKIVPLCHACHNFIHSGRLYKIVGKEKSLKEVKDILYRGFKILAQNDLECFPVTFLIADKLSVDTQGVMPYKVSLNKNLNWSDYRLELNGNIYTSADANFHN